MGKKAHSHYISTGSWKSWKLSVLSVAYFTRGMLLARDIAWSWTDKRNSRGTCWCSALPFSINITLLNREIIAEAFKEQRHWLATSSAEKIASLEFSGLLFLHFSHKATGHSSETVWKCQLSSHVYPFQKFGQSSHCSFAQVCALSIWGSVKILLDIKNPVLRCCKSDMKSIQAFFYKQANIMHILKQLNNCVK